MRQLPRTIPGLIAACLLLSGAVASAQSSIDDYTPVTERMLVDPPAGDWPMWRRTYNHWGHSPLDQIDTTNVGDLRLAWAWTMAEGLQETTPLVHDGVMFLVQACDYVEALDVRDGTRLVGVPPAAGRARRHAGLRQPERDPVPRTSCSSAPTTPTWWRWTRAPARWSGTSRSATGRSASTTPAGRRSSRAGWWPGCPAATT